MKQQMYAFDTHKAVKKLTRAGAEIELAEAMVSTLGTMVEILPTREDLKTEFAAFKEEFQEEIDTKLAALREEFKTDNAAFRAELKTDNTAFRAELKADLRNSEKRLITVLGLMMSVFISVSAIF